MANESFRHPAPKRIDFAGFVQITVHAGQNNLERAIAAANPDQIYHLDAQASVAASWEAPVASAVATGLGTL